MRIIKTRNFSEQLKDIDYSYNKYNGSIFVTDKYTYSMESTKKT